MLYRVIKNEMTHNSESQNCFKYITYEYKYSWSKYEGKYEYSALEYEYKYKYPWLEYEYLSRVLEYS